VITDIGKIWRNNFVENVVQTKSW